MSVGFGSMANRDPSAVAQTVVAAARGAKTRVVLLTGWGGMSTDDKHDDVYFADAIPHDWLFQRVQACVHHCGAGTTGASLTSGLPSVCVPFTMDQPFWAARMHELGVAPKPIPRARLNAQTLEAAISRVLSDEAMRQRAASFGAALRQEHGVATAVGVFNDLAQSR